MTGGGVVEQLSRQRIAVIILFGTAMGFLEAAVVVYLRLLYYPAGFDFPLVLLPESVVLVELGREAATIVMLGAVAVLTGRTGIERFAWFSILFGIWDLVYYAALKLVLDWPAGFMTWDVLFLIPMIWTGPVLAPVIVSIGLIGGGGALLVAAERGWRLKLRPVHWLGLALSLGLLLASFMVNHGRVARGDIPGRFPWEVFIAGCVAAAVVGLRLLRAARHGPNV